MGLSISSEDFVGRWSLSFSDIEFVNGKQAPARLGLAVQLKFFAAHGFFYRTMPRSRPTAFPGWPCSLASNVTP